MPAPRTTGAVALVGSAGLAVGVGLAVTGDGGSQEVAARAPASYAPLDADTRAALAARSRTDDSAQSTRDGGRVGKQDAAERTSRSTVRLPLASVQRATKSDNLLVTRQTMPGVTRTVEPASPQDLAMSMLGDYGWSSDQFSCLDSIYTHESNWTYTAENSSSGAYGIPQALPGEKMASAGADWRSNPATQLEWGLGYIRDRYGSPCGAWGFWQSHSWY